MIENCTIVDAHVHTFQNDEIALKVIGSFNKAYDVRFDNPGTGSVGDVLLNMSKNSIDYTVMTNFALPKILDRNNLWTIETAGIHKNLIPLVSFHPEMDGDFATLLRNYVKLGAKGIKLHPMAQGFDPDHPRMRIIYDYCNEFSFPIVFHCGRVSNARLNRFSDLKSILPVIEKYAEIPLILTHMADGNVGDVLFMAKNYKNVFFDTSIVITGYQPIARHNEPSWLDDYMVADVINTIGAKRVVFGSDYPWGSPGHDIRRILALNLDREQKKLILGENSAGIFKIGRTHNEFVNKI